MTAHPAIRSALLDLVVAGDKTINPGGFIYPERASVRLARRTGRLGMRVTVPSPSPPPLRLPPTLGKAEALGPFARNPTHPGDIRAPFTNVRTVVGTRHHKTTDEQSRTARVKPQRKHAATVCAAAAAAHLLPPPHLVTDMIAVVSSEASI